MEERPRLRRAQLAELAIAAGLEILLEDGLAGGTLPIGYADAFRWLRDHRDLRVSRAQVHNRIWSSLEDYRQDVLIALLDYRTRAPINATADSIERVLREHDGRQRSHVVPLTAEDPETPPDRLQILIELTRAGVEASTSASRSDPHSVVVEAAWAMHASRARAPDSSIDERRSRINAAVQENYQQAIDAFLGLYRRVCGTLGVDLGRHWGISHEEGLRLLAELLYSTNNGAAGRATIEPELQTIPCGGQMWSIEALTAASIITRMASFTSPPRLSENHEAVDVLTSPIETAESAATATRLSREQLRSEMIAAGMAWMQENGFGHGAEHITYARVFERIELQHGLSISRAQVHGRIWESQRDFQLSVIAEAARHRVSPLITDLTEDVSALLTSFDITQRGQSKRAVTEIVRRRGPGTIAGMIASSEWRVAGGVAAFHGTNPTRPERITDALHQSYVTNIDEWTHFYMLFAEVFAYEAQPWTQRNTTEVCAVLARCAVAFTEGVAGRTRLTATPPLHQLQVGGQNSAEWDLTGIGNWCLIHFLLEPANGHDARRSETAIT